MKTLIYNLNYAPELIGIAKYTMEMAEWLVEQGHEVHVVTAPPYYPTWKVFSNYSAWKYRLETINGVKLYRCPLWVPKKPSGLKRIIHLFSFFITSFPIMLWQLFFSPQLVLMIEPPLLCAPIAWLVARFSQAKLCLHVQDFEVDAAIGMKFLSHSFLKFGLFLEKFLMNRFDAISTISLKMQERLVQKGVPKEKTLLFPNWVDTEKIYPLAQPSPMRAQMGFSNDDVIFLYSGNMGAKQGLESIIKSARQLKDMEHLKFVLCGEGPRKSTLMGLAKDLDNVYFLPLQPIDQLNNLLNLADVHLLPQVEEAADLVMPSKLTGMLASGRPMIAMAKAGTQIANVVDGCGLVVSPGDQRLFSDAVVKLLQYDTLRRDFGSHARAYAEQFLEKNQTIARFFESVMP